MRSAPTTIAPILPCFIMAPAILSEITVVGIPSFISSQAVRREPCRKGRVSSALTWIRFRFGALNPERDSHGCCNPDSRRATDHHVADRIRNLLVGLAGDVSFFSRQFGLIDEAHAGIGPFESLNHKN